MKKLLLIVAEAVIGALALLGLHLVLCSDIISGKNAFYLVLSAVILAVQASLFEDKYKYYFYTLFFLGIFCSIFGIRFALGHALPGSIYRDNVGFFIGLSNIIILILVLVGKKKSRFLVYPLLLLTFVPLAIYWGYYAQAHAWLSSDTIMAIMQTNAVEAKEFLLTNFSLGSWLTLATVIGVLFALMAQVSSLKLRPLTKLTTVLLAVVFLADIGLLVGQRKNFYTWAYWQSKKYTQAVKEFKQAKEERDKNLALQLKNINHRDKGVYVLVIGESLTREHMGAYGYKRPTTPWLSSMQKKENLIKFSQSYSSWSNTMQSLVYALTAKNQYNNIELKNAVSLVEVAAAAGMDTCWISNQAKIGATDTQVGVIASGAKKQIWINNVAGANTSSLDSHYDEEVLKALDKLKPSENMLLVIHLLGNHENYGLRYPASFNKYESTSKIDTYDNSVIYNDYIMEQIYQKVTKLPNFKTLLYFSDHGEGVDFGLAHDSNNLKKSMLTIPVYAYMSKDYVQQKPIAVKNLRSIADVPFTNDLIFNLQLSFMGLRVPTCYEPENDPLSEKYNRETARFRTMYGSKKLTELE